MGRIRYTLLEEDENLVTLAWRKRLGQNEMQLANPTLDRWLPDRDTLVTLPTQFILPRAERTGVVVNLPEYRLYVFGTRSIRDEALVRTYPVSIGRQDWNTPTGQTVIQSKTANPTWTPPASIRLEALARGVNLPDVVPAGPDNPLGLYALRLGWPEYLIHGTNRPMAIGMDVTHGCLRMYPDDIETLYRILPVGTPVRVVNQPVKIGWMDTRLYLEVHPPMDDTTDRELVQTAIDLLKSDPLTATLTIRSEYIRRIVEAKTGIPTQLAGL